MADFDWDNLTQEDRHRAGQFALERIFFRLAENEEALQNWRLHATSRLAEDNAATALYRSMSEEIHYLLSSAADHLATVRALVHTGDIPPFAPYTLLRSAIESSALVIWLQNGGSLDKRVFRYIQMQWTLRLNVNTYTTSAGTHTQEITDLLNALLTDMKNARGGIRQKNFEVPMPSITDILIEVDRKVVVTGGLNGLAAWRACSGVTHGNHHFTHGLLDEQPMPQNDRGAVVRRLASLASLALMSSPAIEYLEQAVNVTIGHSQPRPGRPAL